MSTQPDKVWTDEEKSFLLTEILKKAVHPSYLFNIIKEKHINPSWMDIPLPQGRSLHSCQDAFRRMEAEYRPNYPPPITHQTSPGSRKRPLIPGPSPQIPRAIQPKPTHGDPFSPADVRPPVPIPRIPEQPTNERPRKRGRPSKADILKRKAMVTDPLGTSTLPTSRRTMPAPLNLPSVRHGDPSPMSGVGSQPLQVAGVGQPQQQQIETSTSQTEDLEARRIPRPEVGFGPGSPVAVAPSSAGNLPSTARASTLIPPPTPLPPIGSSLGPPSRMLNPSTTDSGSPEVPMAHATPLIGPSLESPRPAPGTEEAKSH